LSRLTDAAVKAYHRGTSDALLADGGGLYMRRLKTGCFWYLKLTSPETGKDQWYSLFSNDIAGAYPAKSLADARAAAKVLWAKKAEGIDPRAQQQRDERARQLADEQQHQAELARQRRLTVRQLFERWAAIELQPHLRADGKASGRKDGGQFVREHFQRRVFDTIGDVAAADVRKSDLLAIIDVAKSEGKLRTANVLLAQLKQMFRFALVREIVERNPLDTVTKRDAGGAEVERERVLSVNEIESLGNQMPQANLSERSRLAVWIILATGCRVGELMGAAWASARDDAKALTATANAADVKIGWVAVEAGTWYLPATKNGRDHTIHLSDFAIKQFEALSTLKDEPETANPEGTDNKPVPWLFPNRARTGPVSVKSFGKQLADRQRESERRFKGRSKATTSLCLGGGNWTAHDLRRTAATLMTQLGFSGDVVDECLNHMIESRVRRTYIRDRRPAEQARAFDALGQHLEQVLRGDHKRTNVIDLPTPIAAAA
jgi:integrase